MPIVKYILLVGASLMALLVAAGHLLESPRANSAPKQTASSIELLQKMANHGGLRPFASSAAAGPFLPMPSIAMQSDVAVAEPVSSPAIINAASAKPSSVLDAQARLRGSDINAQARLTELNINDKPSRPAKKIAARKPKPRVVVVENVQRGPNNFFGSFQSW